MNRNERRRQAHLRLARANGEEALTNGAAAPRVEPEVEPPPFAWCIHEHRDTAPRFAIGTRVIYRGPFAAMQGGTATIVAAAQRLCRLLGQSGFKQVVMGGPGGAPPPLPTALLTAIHDEPAYFLDHLETRDGKNRTHDLRMAFPIWASEAWLEEVPRLVLAT